MALFFEMGRVFHKGYTEEEGNQIVTNQSLLDVVEIDIGP